MPDDPPALSGLTPDQREALLDVLQLTLDVAGVIEPTPFADLSNALISFARRDWVGGGLSALGVVPYVGDLAKAGKFPQYLKAVERAVNLARESRPFAARLRPVLDKLRAVIDRLPWGKLPAPVRAAAERLRRLIDDFVPPGWRAAARLDALTDDVLRYRLGSTVNVGLIPRQNVRLVVEFFDRHKVAGGPRHWAELIKGIDLHAVEAVRVERLPAGAVVAQYVSKGGGAGEWLVRVRGAVSHRNIGVSGEGRVRRLFRLTEPVEVLRSTAAGAADHWTWGRSATHHTLTWDREAGKTVARWAEDVAGGGEQLFLPNARRLLDPLPP